MTDKEKIELLENYCYYMSKLVSDMRISRMEALSKRDPKEVKSHLVGKFPMLQGTSVIMQVERIGNKEFDLEKVTKAGKLLDI